MVGERASGGGNAELRPVRWPGRPGGLTVFRVGLVATLLTLAALLLYARPDDTGCPPTAAPSALAPSSSARPAPDRPSGEASGVEGSAAGANRSAAGSSSPDGSAALPLPAGTVGLPVRLAEPAAVAVLRPGARVDLLAAPAPGHRPTGTEPALVASDALVLDVVAGSATDGSAALYLALPPEQARRAVGLPEGSRFAVVVRG